MDNITVWGSDIQIQRGSGRAKTEAEKIDQYILQEAKDKNVMLWDLYTNTMQGYGYDNIVVSMGGNSSKLLSWNYTTIPILMIGDHFADTDPTKALDLKQNTQVGTVADYTTIVAGRNAGLNFTANGSSGKIINTVGKLTFNGSALTSVDMTWYDPNINLYQVGNWEIYNGDGNSEIHTTYGNNTIVGGNGSNFISTPSTDVRLLREDNPDISKGSNNITLGDGNNTLDLQSGINKVVLGQGNNTINTGLHEFQEVNLTNPAVTKNTIIAGDGSNTINITRTSNIIRLGNGDNKVSMNTILINTPTNNIINSGTGHLDIYGAYDNVTVTSFGSTNIHATDYIGRNLNLTLNAHGQNNVFIASYGNTTLNAAGSTEGIDFYGGLNKDFHSVAIAGNGDDTLTAGRGQSTFTGGLGDNLFAFTKDNTTGGSTVITDFAASDGNQIALFNYGLTRTSLKQLLNASQNDAQGNAILDLGSNNITLQGVSVSELHTNQFFVYNNK